MTLLLTVHLILLLEPSLIVKQTEDAKASIEGVIVRVGSGEPIAGAELKLTRVGGISDAPPAAAASPSAESIGPPVPSTTASDGNGHFIFNGLDAGSYRISAVKNGYAKLEYGQRDNQGPAKSIPVAKGQGIKDIILRLTPAGGVNGTGRDVG